jgi:hypothetical protein
MAPLVAELRKKSLVEQATVLVAGLSEQSWPPSVVEVTAPKPTRRAFVTPRWKLHLLQASASPGLGSSSA